MLGVIYDTPAPNDEPSVEAVYQLMIPVDAVAPRVTVPGPHRDPGVVVAMVGIALTVTTCVVVAGPLHPAALAVMVVVPLQVAA